MWLKIAIILAAFMTAFASPTASATDVNTSTLWTLHTEKYRCLIMFEDAANSSMFQFGFDSSGDYSFGFRPPNWDDDSGREEQQGGRFMIIFGEDAANIEFDDSFMLTRELNDNQPLQPEDFKLFQDYRNFVVQSGGYEMIVPTDGIQSVREEFAQCLNSLSNAGTPPKMKEPQSWERLDELIEPAFSRGDVREVVIEVDKAGRPTDCRIIPNAAIDRMMKNICQFYLSEVQFDPARNSRGEAISGNYVVMQND